MSPASSKLRILLAEKWAPGMTHDEIEKFLSTGKLILRLASLDDKGHPAIHPVWYHYDNDHLYVFTGKNTVKAHNIQRNNNVYFSIDTDTAPNKGVRGKGFARIITGVDETLPLSEKIVVKYLGDSKGKMATGMLESVKKGNAVIVEITPRYYTVWDYSKITM